MLILLYVIFFTAQVFSVNPDQPGQQGTVVTFYKAGAAKSGTLVAEQNGHSFRADEEAATLRLNKRFQLSEIALIFTPLDYNLPSLPIVKEPGVFYRADFIPSLLSATILLRGPPAVVS